MVLSPEEARRQPQGSKGLALVPQGEVGSAGGILRERYEGRCSIADAPGAKTTTSPLRSSHSDALKADNGVLVQSSLEGGNTHGAWVLLQSGEFTQKTHSSFRPD